MFALPRTAAWLLLPAALGGCGANDSTIGLFDSPPADGGGQPPAPCSVGGSECTFGCDEALGCVDCQHDTDCPADQPFCQLGACRGCRTGADCPAAGQTCLPAHHECEQACSSEADCSGEEPFCDPGRAACVECRSDADCPEEEPLCEPDTATCRQCRSAADCSSDEPVCDLADGRCRECVIDAHCPAGTVCGSDGECSA